MNLLFQCLKTLRTAFIAGNFYSYHFHFLYCLSHENINKVKKNKCNYCVQFSDKKKNNNTYL